MKIGPPYTPQQVALDGGLQFHVLQCKHALHLEAKTGMRNSRGSVLKLVQSLYGIKARTKWKAYRELVAFQKEVETIIQGD